MKGRKEGREGRGENKRWVGRECTMQNRARELGEERKEEGGGGNGERREGSQSYGKMAKKNVRARGAQKSGSENQRGPRTS